MISVYEHLHKAAGDISLLAKSQHCKGELCLETQLNISHNCVSVN